MRRRRFSSGQKYLLQSFVFGVLTPIGLGCLALDCHRRGGLLGGSWTALYAVAVGLAILLHAGCTLRSLAGFRAWRHRQFTSVPLSGHRAASGVGILGDGLVLLSSWMFGFLGATSFLLPQVVETRFIAFSLGAWLTAGFLVTLALGFAFQQAATAWVTRDSLLTLRAVWTGLGLLSIGGAAAAGYMINHALAGQVLLQVLLSVFLILAVGFIITRSFMAEEIYRKRHCLD